MMAWLKDGNRMPFHRIAALPRTLEIPLPASTPWEIPAETATILQPAFDQLQAQAAQCEVPHNDDSSMRVLALRRQIDESTTSASARTGIVTSGVVATREGHPIALFFTGRRHAGETLATTGTTASEECFLLIGAIALTEQHRDHQRAPGSVTMDAIVKS